MEEKLTNLVSRDLLWSHVEALNPLHRISGTEADFKAVDYITGKLNEYGIENEVIKFQSYVSHPHEASLSCTLSGGEKKDYRCKTRAFSMSTPTSGLSGEVVYVPTTVPGTGITGSVSGGRFADGDYDGFDVVGKIVLTQRGGPDGILDAQKNGAVGVIQMWAVEEPVLHEMIVSPVWGTPTLEDKNDIIKIPVVCVSYNHGLEIIASCEKGKTAAVMNAKVDTQWRELWLPVATIRGNVEPDRYMLIAGHLDSWYEGITDNATGNAALLELARIFKEMQGTLRRSVKVAWWCGHSYARYSGSTYFCDLNWADLNKNCLGYINIDSPGVKGAVDYSKLTGMAGVETLIKDPVKRFTGTDPQIERPERCADQSFNGVGLTSMYLLMANLAPEEIHPSGGSAGSWWWHSEEDTIDKADPEILATDTKIYAVSAWRMVQEEIIPIKLAPIGQDIVARLKEYSAAAGNLFDLSGVQKKADVLTAALQAFDAAAAAPGADVEKVNRLILKVSKELVQVLYTRSGKFAQDRAIPTPLVPGLYNCFLLDRYKNTNDYGFCLTGLMRERNRLAYSMDLCEAEIAGFLG